MYVFLVLLIVDNLDVDTFVCFGLYEVETLADALKEIAIASRRVTHAVEMTSKKIAVFAFVFVSISAFAVDRWCVVVQDALNEGDGYVVLQYYEHEQCCWSKQCSNSDIRCDRRKVFEESHILDLCEAFGYKSRAVSCDVAVLIDFVFECPARAHDVGAVKHVCFGLDFPSLQITQLFHLKVTGSFTLLCIRSSSGLFVRKRFFASQVW